MKELYTINVSGWQSWVFLFVVCVICMLIGIVICRVNYYDKFMEAYARSKGKTLIPLDYVAVSWIKHLFELKLNVIIMGDNIAEVQGVLEQVKSYNEKDLFVTVYEQVKRDTLMRKLKDRSCPIIATCSPSEYIEEVDKVADSIIVISGIGKPTARLKVLSGDEYIDVEEYFRRIDNER